MLIELLILTAMAGSDAADLVAAATASGRPIECRPPDRRNRTGPSTVWVQAQVPRLGSYCRLIARAHARLAYDPLGARADAIAADKLLPSLPAAQIVLARSAMRLDNVDEAVEAFDRALASDPLSVAHPAAMHDLASALWRSGRTADAARAYRMLVPRAALLPNREQRARVLLEAAHVSMAAQAQTGTPDRLDETLAFLREASKDPHQPLRVDIALSLVLALDRAGQTDQANALLASLQGTARWTAPAPPSSYLVYEPDALALHALALEHEQPAKSAEQWRQFLAQAGSSPWAKAADARRQSLEGGRAGRGRSR